MFYISTAESISRHQGLWFSNFFVQPASPDLLPTAFEPPGYPVLISLARLLGMDAYTGSLLWPRLGFCVLPVLFYMVLVRWMPAPVAMASSLISTLMFSTIKCSLFAWSDIPYLCFSLASLWAAFHIIEKKGKGSALWILLAGLLGGFCFLIRHVGISLNIGILLGFVLAVCTRIFLWRDFIRVMFIYGLGAMSVVGPYLWRNWSCFGTLQPLQMPASQISFQENLTAYSQGLVQMVFTCQQAGPIFLVIAFVFVLWGGWGLRKLSIEKKIFAGILGAYFVLYSSLLLGFKTFYFAPEAINERYLIQISWISVALMVFVLSLALKWAQQKFTIDAKAVSIIALAAFVVLQVFPAVDFYFEQQKIKQLASKTQHYTKLLTGLPSDFVVVSNVAEMVYFYSRRNVRMLGNYTPYGLLKLLATHRKYVVLIIKQEQYSSPAWEYPRLWHQPDGYGKIYSDSNVDFLIPR